MRDRLAISPSGRTSVDDPYHDLPNLAEHREGFDLEVDPRQRLEDLCVRSPQQLGLLD